MFPGNINGKVKAVARPTLVTVELDDKGYKITWNPPKLDSKSPTGVKFEQMVMAEALEDLYKILKNFCYESESEPGCSSSVTNGARLGLINESTGETLRGGITPDKLLVLDDWWFKWNVAKAPLKWDVVFRSYVIEPELFEVTKYYNKQKSHMKKKTTEKNNKKTKEATKFYYHKMSFTALSYMLFKLAPRLLQKLERMEKRTPMFDLAAALCPLLSISNRVFRLPRRARVRWS